MVQWYDLLFHFSKLSSHISISLAILGTSMVHPLDQGAAMDQAVVVLAAAAAAVEGVHQGRQMEVAV